METIVKKPGLRAKWKKILKGTPTKQQVNQFMQDLQRKEQFDNANTVTQ